MSKQVSIVFLFISLFTFSTSCDEATQANLPEPTVRPLSASEAEIASSANNFTFDLMAEIENEQPYENYFISSFSVNTALSMLLNDADQTSQDEFMEVLGLNGLSVEQMNESYRSLVNYIYGLDNSVSLNVANSNWYSDQFTIKQDFADVLTTYYQADIFERNFGSEATLNELNGWIEEETKGKIKNALKSISPDEVMFLINAIYFKASWTSQFDPDATSENAFLLMNGQSVEVPTMTAKVKHWMAYDETLKAQIIELPYGNENYAFTMIMPDSPSDINGLAAKIDVNALNNTLADSTTYVRELYLPKFQLEFKSNLKDVLVNMGMPLGGLNNLFDEERPLAISKVIHQSFLEVNEEGSEAAAVTIIGIETTSVSPSTRVNQPFIFLIRERNSGTILFSGKLLDPR